MFTELGLCMTLGVMFFEAGLADDWEMLANMKEKGLQYWYEWRDRAKSPLHPGRRFMTWSVSLKSGSGKRNTCLKSKWKNMTSLPGFMSRIENTSIGSGEVRFSNLFFLVSFFYLTYNQHNLTRKAGVLIAANLKGSPKLTSTRFKIKVSKDGPYVISGGVPLTVYTILHDAKGIPYGWRAGKKCKKGENYKLCRCGKSNTMPFCDGTHETIKFDGTEAAGRLPYLQQAEVLKGPDLTLTDLPELCVHAGFCDRAGGIWALTQYSDTPEARRIAIKEAANCPSGRLLVWDIKGNLIEPELEQSIALVEDRRKGASGPVWVRGGIPIESADGATYEIRNRVTLCRCGKSKNKPFCDGSHLNK